MKDYALAHTRAMNAGLEPDTPQYFAAVERSVDSMGDGRDPSGLLNEREAARICGVDEQTYAANAAKLRNMRLRGEYGSYAKGKKMADDKYYSKRNPHGPCAGATRPSDPAPKPSDHTEGFPTDKNLKQWKDYSLRNSDDPSIKQSK